MTVVRRSRYATDPIGELRMKALGVVALAGVIRRVDRHPSHAVSKQPPDELAAVSLLGAERLAHPHQRAALGSVGEVGLAQPAPPAVRDLQPLLAKLAEGAAVLQLVRRLH